MIDDLKANIESFLLPDRFFNFLVVNKNSCYFS